MSTHDAIVVGGGPAGSTCAQHLRRAGLDVIVADKCVFPRDKLCAGWITPHVVSALALDLGEYERSGRTLQPVFGFSVRRMGNREARVRYDRPVSYGIRRCELDHYLLERSGAALRLGLAVRRIERARGEWIVDGELRAPLLVGAGGHFCPVARQLAGSDPAREPMVAAQEAEIELSEEQAAACAVDTELPELYFTRDLHGYGWVFRKGRFINVGLGREGNEGIGRQVAEFVAQLEARGKIPRGLPLKMRGHPYLLHHRAARPLCADGALLIGDAAGLAYPKSGEGIRTAVESGILAAQTIAEANGHYSLEILARYEDRIVERFGPRRRTPQITDLLPEPVVQRLAAALFASRSFARRVVLERWFFHTDQKPLEIRNAKLAMQSDPGVGREAALDALRRSGTSH